VRRPVAALAGSAVPLPISLESAANESGDWSPHSKLTKK